MSWIAVLAIAVVIVAAALWTGRGGRPAPPARPRRLHDALDQTGDEVDRTVFPEPRHGPWRI